MLGRPHRGREDAGDALKGGRQAWRAGQGEARRRSGGERREACAPVRGSLHRLYGSAGWTASGCDKLAESNQAPH